MCDPDAVRREPSPVALDSLTLTACHTNPTYEEYLERLKNSGASLEEGKDVVQIEGENTVNTSTNVVYPVEDRSDALTSPIDTSRTMLNTIGTEKWETAGQWIRYRFSVNSSGMYELYSRFKQSYLDGMYVCRTLKDLHERLRVRGRVQGSFREHGGLLRRRSVRGSYPVAL